MPSTTIYVLECENDKYYVGAHKGKDGEELGEIMELHKLGKGSTWTYLYRPLYIIDLIENADAFDLDKTVKKYMAMYGIDNVRGGSYFYNTLPKNEYIFLQKEIDTATERCYNCGEQGHYRNSCPETVRELEEKKEFEKVENKMFKIVSLGLAVFSFVFYFVCREEAI